MHFDSQNQEEIQFPVGRSFLSNILKIIPYVNHQESFDTKYPLSLTFSAYYVHSY